MKEIVRSALAREREIDGTRVLIEPPTVRDALEVLVTYESYLEGKSVGEGAFLDALRRWLPLELFRVFAHEDADRQKVVDHVLQLVLEGIPEPDKKGGKKGGHSIKWPFVNMIGSYCATYGVDPYTMYCTVPWPFFLLFATETTRQNALGQLSHIRANSVQHMTEQGVKKFLRGLENDMGLIRVPVDEKKAAEEGLAMLEALKQEQNGRLR